MKLLYLLTLILILSACGDDNPAGPKDENPISIEMKYPIRISYVIPNPAGNDNQMQEEFGIINVADSLVSSNEWVIVDKDNTRWDLSGEFAIRNNYTFVYKSDKSPQLNNNGDKFYLYFKNILVQTFEYTNAPDGDTLWLDIEETTNIDTSSYIPTEQLELALYNDFIDDIYHENYMLSYNYDYRVANWVGYELLASELADNVSRTDNFKADPKIKSNTNYDLDYAASYYDRGHLLPADNCTWNEVAMDECFYYSNIAPQIPEFNRGVWKAIEFMEREIALKYGRVWVVNVPIFHSNQHDNRFGTSNIRVPDAFGKAFLVLDDGTYKGSAILLAHKEYNNFELEDVVVPIDELEILSGVDIFYLLDDAIEADIESALFYELYDF